MLKIPLHDGIEAHIFVNDFPVKSIFADLTETLLGKNKCVTTGSKSANPPSPLQGTPTHHVSDIVSKLTIKQLPQLFLYGSNNHRKVINLH